MFLAHARRPLVHPVICFGFAALCAASTACVSSGTQPSNELDGSIENPDATLPDAGQDAAPGKDAETDARDAGERDAEVDAREDADSGPVDAGPCKAILASAFAANLNPPKSYLGLDLSNGGANDGGLGTGGLTIDATDLLGCAASVEPTALDAGVSPQLPGYRQITLDAPSAPGAATLSINMQSRVIEQVTLNPGYTGQLPFHSRSGGAYGTHTYVITIQSSGDAGSSGEVLRDGVPFAADWNLVAEDGGKSQASPWANELYDGLMATFAPSTPAVADCLTSQSAFDLTGLPIPGQDCLFISNIGTGSSLLGIRPLSLYVEFNQLSNQVNEIYAFWRGGTATCATEQAALEQMEWGAITLGGYYQNEYSYYFAGTEPMRAASNALGLTDPELNTLFGCGGTTWTPPDNGYGGMQWGSGSVAAEYNLDSGVNYKVYALSGYEGTWQFSEADGGAYTIGVGSMTLGSSPVTIDWTSATTADPTVTSIANALYGTYCSAPPDTDCVAQGDCTIVTDDGKGHSTFTLAPGANMAANYCPMQAITVVFAKGSSTPEQIYVTNPGGQ
jgi:hypothetical protein